jgi:YjbR
MKNSSIVREMAGLSEVSAMAEPYPCASAGTLRAVSFDAIANEFLTEPGVDEGTGFGSNPGLRVGGKIFAMEVDGRLVVKLPAERVTALTEAGAEPFVIGKRTMREWVSVEPRDDWAALAREAFAFVRTSG